VREIKNVTTFGPLRKFLGKSSRASSWKVSCDAHVYEAFVDMVEF